MIWRILGSILICVSCSILGLYFGSRIGRRIEALTALKRSLLLLSHEIEYAINPIYIAFRNISLKSSGELRIFYKILADKTEQENELVSVWERACLGLKLPIPKEILLEFTNLGKYLNGIDKQVQLSAIKMLNTQIDCIIEPLYTEDARERRLYRGLGVLAGLLIVIILI